MLETWLDSKAATVYVGCKSVTAFYSWRKRHGIPKRSNGTVNKADLDRALKYRPKRTGGSVRNLNSLSNLQNLKKRQEESTT